MTRWQHRQGWNYTLTLEDAMVDFSMNYDSSVDHRDADRFYILEIWPEGKAGARAIYEFLAESGESTFNLNGDINLFLKYRGEIENSDGFSPKMRPGLDILFSHIFGEVDNVAIVEEDSSRRCQRVSEFRDQLKTY